MNLNDTNLFAFGYQIVDHFFGHIADGAHGNDHTVSIGCAMIVEQAVIGAQLFIDHAHILFYHSGQSVVHGVAGFTMLEEDIAVLVRAAHGRMLGVQCFVTELLDGIHVQHFLQVLVVPLFLLLDLVRGTEAIEEVYEGHTAFNGSQVSNGRQVHNFLHAALGQHGAAGLTGGHNIGMIAENVQRLGCHGTCRNIEHAGKLLSCDLVHIGDHQQQALRGREGGGDSTCAQAAVNGTCCAGLRLELNNLYLVAEHILLARCAPLVDHIGHGAGGGNGVDGSHVRVGISYMGRSGVAIHRLLCSCYFRHSFFLRSIIPCGAGIFMKNSFPIIFYLQ